MGPVRTRDERLRTAPGAVSAALGYVMAGLGRFGFADNPTSAAGYFATRGMHREHKLWCTDR